MFICLASSSLSSLGPSPNNSFTNSRSRRLQRYQTTTLEYGVENSLQHQAVEVTINSILLNWFMTASYLEQFIDYWWYYHFLCGMNKNITSTWAAWVMNVIKLFLSKNQFCCQIHRQFVFSRARINFVAKFTVNLFLMRWLRDNPFFVEHFVFCCILSCVIIVLSIGNYLCILLINLLHLHCKFHS